MDTQIKEKRKQMLNRFLVKPLIFLIIVFSITSFGCASEDPEIGGSVETTKNTQESSSVSNTSSDTKASTAENTSSDTKSSAAQNTSKTSKELCLSLNSRMRS